MFFQSRLSLSVEHHPHHKTHLQATMLTLALLLTSLCLPQFANAQRITHTVPIIFVSLADNDRENLAFSKEKVKKLIGSMNRIQFREHKIAIRMKSYRVLYSTRFNQTDVGFDGNDISRNPKEFVDPRVNRRGNQLVVFFNKGFPAGNGLSFGGTGVPSTDPSPFSIIHCAVSDKIRDTGLTCSHEIGHSLGLAHLDEYSDPRFSIAANPDNRMWGGTIFEPWQANIMKTRTNYVRRR